MQETVPISTLHRHCSISIPSAKHRADLNDLNIFLVGDLKYGRTVHSLMMAMSRWNATFNFISPEELKMPDEFKLYLDNLGLKYYEHTDFTDIISKADIIYMTRVQKERFSDPIEYEKVKNVYVLRNSMLKNTKPNMRILHPLPRVNEIHQDVDHNPKAYYFEQALNGVYTRQAILCSLIRNKIRRDRAMKEPKQMSVSAIQNGTVIDHVPARNLFKVIQILGLDRIDNQITFGTNLESKKLGRKAIIKISGHIFRG